MFRKAQRWKGISISVPFYCLCALLQQALFPQIGKNQLIHRRDSFQAGTVQPGKFRDEDDDYYGYDAGGESDFAAAGYTLKEGSDDDDLAAADAEELDDSDDFSDDYSDEDMD